MFALWLEGLNCTAQRWRVIIMSSLPAQRRGRLCPPMEMLPDCGGSTLRSFANHCCGALVSWNVREWEFWVWKSPGEFAGVWHLNSEIKVEEGQKIDFIEWNRWLFSGPTSRTAFEAEWSLSSNELNYNKYKAKSVVLALTVFDQTLQKWEYLMAWISIFLYSQNTQGAELESMPEGTKTKLRSCSKNEMFLAFSLQFSGL